MKITLVNNNVLYERGKGLYIYKETGKFFQEVLEYSNIVTLFQFSMPMTSGDFLTDFDVKNKGFNLCITKRRGNKLWAYIKAFLAGIKAVFKSDFIYMFYPGNICIYLAIVSWLLRKPYGFYVRGEKGIDSKISRFLYKRARVILTISPIFTQRIQEIGGKAQTIRPMMTFSEIDINESKVLKNKGLLELLFVGRVEYEKGIFELLEALKLLKEKGVEGYRLNIVGDGKDSKKIQELISSYNLNSTVEFHGTITEKSALAKMYMKSDIFVFPSHHEGFPRVLYESMIFKVPIITTFVGSISHLMKDGYNCKKITPKSSESIALELERLLSDFSLRKQYAENGTKTITEYLSDKKDSHASQLLNIITNNN